MGIIENLFGPRIAKPKPAPCGHVPPTFKVRNSSTYIVITLTPRDFGSEYSRYSMPGAVWCGDGCGWVNLTDEEYSYYASYCGNA